MHCHYHLVCSKGNKKGARKRFKTKLCLKLHMMMMTLLIQTTLVGRQNQKEEQTVEIRWK